MRFRRKKKGSSLIFVVIMFMFVMVVSTAMLSMVSGNYTARVVESKRVENLYGAESGLDIAYNVIAKTIDNANEDSYEKVEQFKADVESLNYDNFCSYKNSTDKIENYKAYLYALKADIDYQKNITKDEKKIKKNNENIDVLINHVFRYYFEHYINTYLINNIKGENNDGNKGKYLIDVTKSQDDTSNINEVSYNDATINFNKESLDNNKEIIWNVESEKPIEISELIEKYYYENENGKVKYILKTIPYKNLSYTYYEKSTVIDLISEYEVDSNIGNNKRKIESKYILTVPSYDDVSFKNSFETGVRELPGITVGGNVIVNNSQLDVYGDIMVEGNSGDTNTLANKYSNGIIINNENSTDNDPKTINFYNNVFCRKTFDIKDNVAVNINKNLYAKNIYVNTTNYNKKSYLGINENNSKVVLNNDLEINANNTDVYIRDFYGISDKTLENTDTVDDKAQKSSSIIINNQFGNSWLTIENRAYINGVAHIKTESGYQTGESVAVKGNYQAYSIPLDTDDKFMYDKPLQLLKEDSNNPNNKREHFYKYWSNNSQNDVDNAKNDIDIGGVIFNTIDNVHSIGSIVYGERALDESITKKVKKADSDSVDSDFNNTIDGEQLDYAKNMYNLNVADESKVDKTYNIDSSDIESIDNIMNTSQNINGNGFKFENNSVDINNIGKFKGIFVVNGDLNINADYEIEGNLIVLGNLNIDSGAKLTLKYDRDLTKNIQNENLSKFAEVFDNEYGGADLENGEATSASNGASFLKTKQWRIIK
ncbi:MAG: hypothetical protein E6Z86_08290 [Clostridium butyricum]|nr:hypothetical protein [Clostridium butyricum]MDU5819881.1 hypothetical protein [Clostridium butyricum]